MELLDQSSSPLNKKQNTIRDFIMSQGILIVFLILVLIVGAIRPEILRLNNIISVLCNISIIGIMACAMTFVIIGGNFDISVGSFISFGNIFPLMILYNLGPGSEFTAIFLTLLVGIIYGCINGLLVGFLRINSFMATLAMLSIVSGIAQLCWEGNRYAAWLPPDGTLFSTIGRGMVGGIVPTPVIIFLATALVLGIILSKTVWGRYVYAVGGNPQATRFAGIRSKWVTLFTFVVMGLTSAVAAIVWGSRYMDTNPQQGQALELTVITAVILGGTSLAGGTGSVWKTVLGVIIIGFINNAVITLGFPFYYQWVATWICIIGAVWLDTASKRRSES